MSPGLIGAIMWLATQREQFAQMNRCHAHEQRCEAECNEDHPGGSLARMRCYERCQSRELVCRRDGSDEP